MWWYIFLLKSRFIKQRKHFRYTLRLWGQFVLIEHKAQCQRDLSLGERILINIVVHIYVYISLGFDMAVGGLFCVLVVCSFGFILFYFIFLFLYVCLCEHSVCIWKAERGRWRKKERKKERKINESGTKKERKKERNSNE